MQKIKFFPYILRNIYNVNGRGKNKKRILKIPAEILTGLAVGAINGLLGGGGGMLCVPLLEKGLGESVKISHASTVLVILPVCVAGAFVYAANGTYGYSALIVAAGAVAGGILGSVFLKNAGSGTVAVIFALLTIAAGVRSVWK